MIYRYILFVIIFSLSMPNELTYYNSIYDNARSPRINALGNCIFLSDNISDVFLNPIKTNQNQAALLVNL